MSLTSAALQPYLVRQLMGLRGRLPVTHLADIIVSGPRSGYDLDFGNDEIVLDFREPSFIGEAIAADASRFAVAAFLSMKTISEALEQSEGLAWALVRSYYASFYAGHSIIRLLARSCSYLDQLHVRKIRELAAALGKDFSFSINSGLYDGRLNSTQTGISLKQARGRVGGAHEVFWGIFDDFLSESTENVLLGHLTPEEARNVFLKLDALRYIFRRGAGASWLSEVRNNIQYRHAYSVWGFSSVNKKDRLQLSRISRQWNNDPMNINIESPPGGDLGAFVAAASFVVALCRDMLSYVAERSTVGRRSFVLPVLQIC